MNGTICRPLLPPELHRLCQDRQETRRELPVDVFGRSRLISRYERAQKRTGFTLKGVFMRDFLEKRPFYKQSYDEIILQLSRLYNLVRTRGAPVTGDSSAGGTQSAFVRQTTKYWVR